MKTTIFNKKRIVIAISVLFIMTIVISLCSFAPPSFSDQSEITISIPSQIDLENLIAIVNFQHELGFFNNLIPVACFMSTSNNQLRLILTRSDVDFSFSLSSGSWVFTGGADNSSYYRMSFTSDGFSLQQLASNSVRSDRLLFYRSSLSSSFVVNPDYLFSDDQNGQNSITDVVQYYAQLYNIVINYEDNIPSAEFVGYSEGFDFGVENGYRLGFDEGEELGYESGYSEGESNGYSSGHQVGFEEGRDEGYEFGYDAGYDEGYSEGYETGYQSGLDDGDSSEPLQIFKAYIFSFDENNVLQYSWYNETFGLFSWVNYNSHFDPTKPPYYFIVRLTESDLNNSSTQIELPFDFISSPGNRDYSVASFDPEFLTGYGDSISLFVNKSRSYDNGYNVGLQDGANLLDGISDISAKPIGALRDALDFELFGVNIGLVVVALVSVLIVFAAYKFVKKIFPI